MTPLKTVEQLTVDDLRAPLALYVFDATDQTDCYFTAEETCCPSSAS